MISAYLLCLGGLPFLSFLISLPFGYNSLAYPNGPNGPGGNGDWPQWTIWGRWGVVLYYVLLLLCFAWCSYRATRQTGSVGNGLLAAGWVALLTIISAITPAVVMSLWVNQVFFGQEHFFSDLLFTLQAMIESCAFLLLPFLFMALLIGMLSSWLAKQISTQIDRQS